MTSKYLKSIPLLIGFLLLFQIAKGQIFSRTTPNFGKQICLPVTLMDTIIHDLKERKLLLAKDSIYRGQIFIIKDSLYRANKNTYQIEKSLLISEKKRVRNGWHRNILLLFIFTLGVICTK